MIIVRRFLHQVDSRPHKGIAKNAETVFKAQHNKNAKQTQYSVVIQHPVTRKWLQEFKTDKIKSKIGLNEGSANPSRENSTNGFNGYKQAKNNSESNKRRIIHLLKKPFIEHNYL